MKKAYIPTKTQLKRGKSHGSLTTMPSDKRLNTWSQNFETTRDKFTPNNMQDTTKVEYGYIHDNSYTNASDPNTIIDKPGVPRSFQ